MRRAGRVGVVAASALALAACWGAGRAEAGPARYDKETRSFTFAYTFADLPGGVGSVIGTVRKPSQQQEDTVKGLVGAVSDVLAQVTDGRARIGRLDYVDDIKNADLVISLVGRPASPGWAHLAAIDGKPGQLVLYYQSLEPKIRQDVVFTAAHEVLHYVFGLADEYDSAKFPGNCPRGTGPGCLMDNYNAGARGFMGRLCTSSDHNSQPSQRASCREIVDQFFSKMGVQPGDPAGSTAAIANAGGDPLPRVDPRVQVIQSVVAKVRAERLNELDKGKSGTSSLQTFARKTLTDLIARYNRDNPDKIILGGREASVLKEILRQGEAVPVRKPESLDPKVFERLRDEANRLANDFRNVASQSSRLSKIRSGLQQYLRSLNRIEPLDRIGFSPAEQRRLVEQIARDASRDPKERDLERLGGLADRGAQLGLATAEDVIRILDALGEPGTPERFAYLNRLRGELSDRFGIVGRDSTRFGFRRTRIITPDPLIGDLYVPTQGGVFPYATIRDRSTVQFSRLVDRAKIELVAPSSATRELDDAQSISSRISQPFGQIEAEDPNARRPRRVDLQQTIADTIDQLKRDRLENIALLVPPGGLPVSIGEQVAGIRSRFGSSGLNVRLDLVLVGTPPIDAELRDAVVDSRGSVLLVTDIDEIGAIAQRLKNEQSSGSWVIIPQQSNFTVDPSALLRPAQGGPAATSAEPRPDELDKWIERVKTVQLEPSVLEPQPPDAPGPELRRAVLDALGAARGQISRTLNRKDAPPTFPQSVVQRATEAIAAIDAIRALIGDENVSELEGNDSILSIMKDMSSALERVDREGAAAYAAFTLRPTGLNARLERTIGLAKDRLGEARNLLELARRSTDVDPITSGLIRIAKLINRDRAEVTKLKESMPNADAPTVEEIRDLRQLENLGRDLENVTGLLRVYERVLEAAYLASRDDVPVYKRIDRRQQEIGRLLLERAAVQRLVGGGEDRIIPDPTREVRLARFYAEGNAEFEMIVGLSQELPRDRNLQRTKPELRLLSDSGIPVGDTAKVRFDENTSTPTLLVWRASTPPLSPGWYTPILRFREEQFQRLRKDQVNFTFSVGSNRPNVQLITALANGSRSVNEGAPQSASNGSLNRADGPAVVEVQVSAGSSVLGARMLGIYQALPTGSDEITFQEVAFRDDGRDANGNPPESPTYDAAHRDRQAGDGIYTAFIPLQGVTRDTEFRIFVQADTTDGRARFIGLDDPNRGDDRQTPGDRQPNDPATRLAERQSTDEAEGKVFEFQRATSVHFHVRP